MSTNKINLIIISFAVSLWTIISLIIGIPFIMTIIANSIITVFYTIKSVKFYRSNKPTLFINKPKNVMSSSPEVLI